MDQKRWQQVDRLLEAALELPSGEREAFLDRACEGDAELRKEVESLIAHDSAGSFMEMPAAEEAARLLADAASGSLAGRTIGPYKILEKLGEGGMGEVYLALHTRTNRRVALKLLPACHSKDKERVERFRQEARAVLALNHPNVVTVYDIEEAGDANIIASEFIEGETLRRRMARARLLFQETLDIAIQTAAALAAAHEAGIIHRDIKPENIMVRKDGYVKVLDFGLAKLTGSGLMTGPDEPTLVQVNTEPGIVMGTVSYMSPEQARGLPVDQRTDIFSFGIVLYEMLTGHLPFMGETKSDVIAAILQKEPPPLAIYWPQAPDVLEWIVARALTKERDERYQTAKELLADLKRLRRRSEYEAEAERSASVGADRSASASEGRATPSAGAEDKSTSTAEAEAVRTAPGVSATAGAIKRHKRVFILALVGLIVVTAGVVLGLRYSAQDQPSAEPAAQPLGSRMQITRLTTSGNATHVAISPDGKVVFQTSAGGNPDIWVMNADGTNQKQLTADASVNLYPCVPPDGRYIVFNSDRAGEHGIWRMDASGENVTRLTDQGLNPHCSPDGRWVFYYRASGGTGLWKVPIEGGSPVHIPIPAKDGAASPAVSPDGRLIACNYLVGGRARSSASQCSRRRAASR